MHFRWRNSKAVISRNGYDGPRVDEIKEIEENSNEMDLEKTVDEEESKDEECIICLGISNNDKMFANTTIYM